MITVATCRLTYAAARPLKPIAAAGAVQERFFLSTLWIWQQKAVNDR